MTRDEYLQILRDNLTTMTDDEKDDVIRYYLEYFIDSGDEQAVIEELGAPEKLAVRLCGTDGTDNRDTGTSDYERTADARNSDSIHAQNSFSQQESEYTNGANSGNSAGEDYTGNTKDRNYDYSGEEYNTKKKKSVGKTIFLICTSPVWIPLAFGGISIAFGLGIAVIAVILSVFAVFAVCVAAGACCVIAGVVGLTKSLADGLVVLGGGLFMFGIGILAFFLGKYIAKGFGYVMKKIVKRN